MSQPVEPVAEQASTPKKVASSCWALSCAAILIMVMAAVAGPKLISARIPGNESAAIGALRGISNSQTLQREKGQACGDLAALRAAGLIDEVLASGTKQGYTYVCSPSTTKPEFQFFATASPVKPGETGRRYFVINHAGDVYESDAPISVDPATCEIPPGLQRAGR